MTKFYLMPLVILTMMLCGKPAAATLPESMTLGAGLDTLMGSLESSVRQASSEGKGNGVRAGVEATLVINNARIAYADNLGQSLKEFNTVSAGRFHELEALVLSVERNRAGDLTATMTAIKRAASSLVFPEGVPHLTGMKPLFFVPSERSYPVRVEFTGNFTVEPDAGPKPSLRVNGKLFSPVEASGQKLVFPVPVHEFMTGTPGSFTHCKVELVVPYTTGRFVFRSQREAKFALLMGGSPPSPGRVLLFHKGMKTLSATRHVITQKWSQNSSSSDLEADYCSENYPEWSIKPASVKFVVARSQGKADEYWSKTLRSTTPRVCYHVETVHNPHGVSGRVDFHLEFDAEKTTDEEIWDQEEVAIRWGESRSYRYPEGSWKVVFATFDGRHYEYTTASTDNPLLKLVANGESVTISAPPTQNVVWP